MTAETLRTKILTTLLLVGIIPLLFLGILAIYLISLFHQADIAAIESNLLNQKTAEINESLQEVFGTFELQVGFEQVSDIELSQQYFLLEQFLKEMPELEEISFISLSGQTTSLLRPSQTGQQGNTASVIDENLVDLSQTEKYRKAAAGHTYLGPVYYTFKGPRITLASPVRNRNGIVISVLTGELNLGKLQRIVTKSFLGETGYLYVVDQDGFLVAHSQKDKLPEVGIDRPESHGSRYQSFWGQEVAAARIAAANLGLSLVAEWPVAEADEVVNTIRNQILMFSSLVLLFTLGLTIILTQRIVRPIKILEQWTRRVAKGEFDQEVRITTGDELEALGRAFNQMMAGLRELEELKKEFVFIAAHELRTPVTAIKGYLSMVMEGEAGEVKAEMKNLLSEVVAANNRLIQLVNDLLQVARAEAGRLTIQVQPIPITEPIEAVIHELQPLADQKQIRIEYQGGKRPQVLADDQRLKEVMVNLLGNAIKYTPGAGIVTISHEQTAEGLVTHVKDTGIGMSAEEQQKLFEKFYRVQNEKTREITGTGLGLFIVKQIIEKMNGRIWVRSEAGKGSTFSFAVPLAPKQPGELL